MSEINESDDKTVRGGRKMTLKVRRTVESGHVRQSFSHGRSKSVLVEKKKRRAVGGTPAAQPVEDVAAEQEPKREAGVLRRLQSWLGAIVSDREARAESHSRN